MSAIIETVWMRLLESSPWEYAAMVLSILYLLLAARENIWCWAAAFISTAIYIVLFYDAVLLLESLLNIFYLLMAVYGWYEWRYRKSDKTGRAISAWSLRRNLLVVSTTFALVLLAGYLFGRYTQSQLPYLDAFTTCFAVVATFMVPWKILDNWIYWLVIDLASIYLYISRGLYVTALLFCIYIVLIVWGYIRWLREYRAAH
jgi:nicotinamide mononucleotide transporter